MFAKEKNALMWRRIYRHLLLICFKICKFYVETKWQLLRFYYIRLLFQAEFLYRQSELFNLRWQQLGLEFARESFASNAEHFLWKARREPLRIRLQLFLDGLFDREMKSYYLPEDN